MTSGCCRSPSLCMKCAFIEVQFNHVKNMRQKNAKNNSVKLLQHIQTSHRDEFSTTHLGTFRKVAKKFKNFSKIQKSWSLLLGKSWNVMKDIQILDMLGISGRRVLRAGCFAPCSMDASRFGCSEHSSTCPSFGGPRLSFLASYDGFVGWKETAECAYFIITDLSHTHILYLGQWYTH
jgi:hypothetical protein